MKIKRKSYLHFRLVNYLLKYLCGKKHSSFTMTLRVAQSKVNNSASRCHWIKKASHKSLGRNKLTTLISLRMVK
jgi:hypothetical protein